MFQLVLISCLISVGVSEVIYTQTGAVRGTTSRNQNGELYNAFLAIPYAEPPIGNLRFRDPVPKDPWSHIHDGSQVGVSCPQTEFRYGRVNQSEDCLTLNIYTKNTRGRYPVIFYIHGGVYFVGTSVPTSAECTYEWNECRRNGSFFSHSIPYVTRTIP